MLICSVYKIFNSSPGGLRMGERDQSPDSQESSSSSASGAPIKYVEVKDTQRTDRQQSSYPSFTSRASTTDAQKARTPAKSNQTTSTSLVVPPRKSLLQRDESINSLSVGRWVIRVCRQKIKIQFFILLIQICLLNKDIYIKL